MRKWFGIILVVLCGLAAEAAECPFFVPVVTIPPHSANGFSWSTVIRPMGDACIEKIAVDPTNSNAWYAGGFYGLYMTKTNGASWTKPLSGNLTALLVVQDQPNLVYAAIANQLYLSRDSGATWNVIKTFDERVYSLFVSGTKLYVGLAWDTHAVPSGLWVSNLGGGFMSFHPFGPGHTGLIVWTISRDEASGVFYIGTEIFDHPTPYQPPFFRSANAANFTNVGAGLPHHVVDTAVRPDGYLYALTEGYGLYGSANMGTTFMAPFTTPTGAGSALLMDPDTPTRVYVGRQKIGLINGGLFISHNSGQTYKSIGLAGVTIGDVTLNGAGTRIYAATYGSGIYTSVVPVIFP